MKGNLKFREVRTASGSTAIQIIRYSSSKHIIVKHVGSATTEEEPIILRQEAERVREDISKQLSFFPLTTETNLLHEKHR